MYTEQDVLFDPPIDIRQLISSLSIKVCREMYLHEIQTDSLESNIGTLNVYVNALYQNIYIYGFNRLS